MSITLQQTIPNALADRLRDAHALMAEFLSGIVMEPSRLFASERTAKADRIQQLIRSQAWTDAALALVEMELPQWQVRRLVHDGGEWFCTLSRLREMPDWLDQPVESHHADLALAILDAFAQARRISAPQDCACIPVPPSVTPMFEPICSENFA
jgi:hypothetical protein